MANGNIDDIKRDKNDLIFWNTDVSVEPAVMTIGTKGRDANGNWRYTLVSGDGANLVRSDDAGLMRVSTVGGSLGTVTTSPLSADSSTVSAIQGDAGKLRISAIGVSVTTSPLSADSSSISAKSGDAAFFRVSAVGTLTVSSHEVKQSDATSLRISTIQGDAGLMRVSSIGTGSFSPLSADSSNVSSKQGDAGLLRVSAIISTTPQVQVVQLTDPWNVSAKSDDAGLMRVSAIGGSASLSGDAVGNRVSSFQTDAGVLRVSAIISDTPNIGAIQITSPWQIQGTVSQADAGLLRVSSIGGSVTSSPLSADSSSISAVQADAGKFLVSAKSGDAGLFRVSALGVTATTSPLSADSSSISAIQEGANRLRVSAFVDSGSVSAKSSDAGTLLLSAKSGDAGQLLTSAIATGNIASGSTDSGNPVKTGGKYNSTKPTFTDGQRGDTQLTTRGATMVSLFANDSNVNITNLSDNLDGQAVAATANKLAVMSRNTVFNLTSWDRQVGDVSGTWVKAPDAGFLRMSAIGTLTVSAHEVKQSDAASMLVSAKSDSAGQLRISAFSDAANLFRVSAIGTVTVSAHEVKQSDAASMLVSAKSDSAGQLRISAFSNDAALLRVSADIVTDTVGSLTVFRSINLSASQAVKATAAGLYGYYLWSSYTKPAYVKFYNTSGAINVGTDTPILTVMLPASAAANVEFGHGLKGFTNGMGIVALSAAEDNATTGVAASSVGGNIFYV